MSDITGGDSSRAPTVTELIQREIQATGDWTRHPWWCSDPEFLRASGLTIEVVESAFAELRHTFDPAWALRRTKDGTAHWFLKTIAVPMRPTLEVLVELGLALVRIECANAGAATRLRRELREAGDRTGAYYEGVVGALLVGKNNIEWHPPGRDGKVLDLRLISDWTLDIEAKVVGPTRQDEINDACLLALSRTMFDRMPGAGDRSRCVRIDLNDYAVSFLMAPNSQSKHKVASLEEHARGLAGLLADALAHHDPNGYGVDEILGQTVESWPREHDGTQVGIYGALIESRTIAERIYRNALADAVEKFEENANGVIFVDVRTGSADLGYFAGMWELATATPVFRNVANVVVTWRAEGAARRCGHFEATIFSNRNHPRAAVTAEVLRRNLTAPDDAPPSATVRDPPLPGPSTWGRKASFSFAVTIPPLSTKNVVVVPNAEPPAHFVQEFLERQAKTSE